MAKLSYEVTNNQGDQRRVSFETKNGTCIPTRLETVKIIHAVFSGLIVGDYSVNRRGAISMGDYTVYAS